MIFYFTGTGNSLFVALKIQKADGGELIDMGKALKEKNFDYTLEKGEKVGFVFPVYFYGLPTITAEFIDKLNLKTDETPFIYTVITCGATIGGADKMLAKLLKSKNLKLNSSYSVKMPSNYIIMYDIANYEDTNSAIEMSKEPIEKLIEGIKKTEEGYFADHGPMALFTPISYKIYDVYRKTKKFHVNEKCTNCGQCEKICPSQVIKIDNEKPEWTEEKCSHCTACINRCPSKAIEYGDSTINRERYSNPYIEFN